jgi:hypothetical protein
MKYVYKPGHPKATQFGFVKITDIDQEPSFNALNAPIMMDRFYENTAATDGVDIGSRRKHREYMKQRGLAPSGDFSKDWYAKQKRTQELETNKERREDVSRATYEVLDRRK